MKMKVFLIWMIEILFFFLEFNHKFTWKDGSMTIYSED